MKNKFYISMIPVLSLFFFIRPSFSLAPFHTLSFNFKNEIWAPFSGQNYNPRNYFLTVKALDKERFIKPSNGRPDYVSVSAISFQDSYTYSNIHVVLIVEFPSSSIQVMLNKMNAVRMKNKNSDKLHQFVEQQQNDDPTNILFNRLRGDIFPLSIHDYLAERQSLCLSYATCPNSEIVVTCDDKFIIKAVGLVIHGLLCPFYFNEIAAYSDFCKKYNIPIVLIPTEDNISYFESSKEQLLKHIDGLIETRSGVFFFSNSEHKSVRRNSLYIDKSS